MEIQKLHPAAEFIEKFNKSIPLSRRPSYGIFGRFEHRKSGESFVTVNVPILRGADAVYRELLDQNGISHHVNPASSDLNTHTTFVIHENPRHGSLVDDIAKLFDTE